MPAAREPARPGGSQEIPAGVPMQSAHVLDQARETASEVAGSLTQFDRPGRQPLHAT
jgi:hypothetical protein